MILNEIVGLVRVHVLENWQLAVPVLAVSIAIATYTITSIGYFLAARSTKDGRSPPTIPYWLPVLGSTIPFVADIEKFVHHVKTKYGDDKPYTIKLLGQRSNLITKPEDFSPILRSTKYMSNKPLMAELMEKVFGTPEHVMTMYRGDISGINQAPIPGTNIPDHQRIWHNQHADSARYLVGDSLRNLAARYVSSLSEALAVVDPQDPTDSGEWVDLADFYPWWKSRVFTAAVTALFGPHLMRLNPTFEADFWAFVDYIPTLVKSYPRWMAPRAYAARDKVIGQVKKWHRFARENADYRNNGSDVPKWDEYWGSVWLKVRQRWGQDTNIMDDDGLASEDLALLVAANANAIPMAFWNLIEVYKDRELLSRVLPELQTGIVSPADQDPSEPLRFDLSPVLASPLLQSIYAEVLRMRISLMVTRMPDRGDFKYGPWEFKHGAYIALPSAYIGYHEGAWAAHTKDGERPIDQFWAERFLVPSAEEADKADNKKTKKPTTEKSAKATKMQFSTEHVEGIWTPYGGGALMCPGRHLAKQEMMGGVTVFAAYYDLEVAEGWVPKMNPAFYGMGAQQPAEPTPVRIRRRTGGWKAEKQ